ncbi:class I SAM-dependent methyltransferase [Thalassospira sp. GB04J01]|uniref:class I SAM-dependent methyltransferase n=1 Tax=Thalassospira sp. GB04J01 TaxID=1485225 RepID=UPI000C9A4FAE|nr:class I SAM-dependent methyltransferase [Thalassospira sp. GB04J01]|tara:strand:- start:8380 stop:9129 length:750 start_codon:yes stop_codon:yes gene_type:complete
MNKVEQQHFDACASVYETEIGEEYPQWLKWHLIEKYAKHGDRVVDIGGANGRHALDAALKVACETICVDISEGMLKQLKQRPDYLLAEVESRPTPVVASALELPIHDETVDLAWSYATLLLIPDQQTAISEMVRIVKPGGIVILDIGNVWNLGWLYWRRFYLKRGFPGIFPMSRRQIGKLVHALGCQTLEDIPTGILSQILLLPYIDKVTRLRDRIHKKGAYPDLDGRCSKLLPIFANRYYLVLRKKGG